MEIKSQVEDVAPVDMARQTSLPGETTEYNLTGQNNQLERGLKSRQIQFLALGGAIGTGLFIGSGSLLAKVGPASLFLGYLGMIFVVWVIMNCLAEMVTYLPLRGITVPYFIARFVDPSLAFAAGWNYWLAYSILVGAEATAAGIIIDYWQPPTHIVVWIAVILVINLALNLFAVKVFGEAEFWFASIKIITLVGLMILGVVIFFGGGPRQDGILGFRYWKHPGAFKEFGTTGNTGRFLGFWHAFIIASFAFITSPELISMAAGETLSPRRNVPKAARRFVWRLAIFYGFCSLVIGVIVPSDDPKLLGASSDASASPFVISVQHVGIPVLNHILNAAILTSAASAGNTFLYSGSRVLYSLAIEGKAPRICARTTNEGVPWVAVLVTWAGGLLAFLNASNDGATVFNWFVNIIVVAGLMAWVIICITYLRFRKAMIFHGLLTSLPYKTPLQPYTTWIALVLVTLLTLTNGFQIFISGNWKTKDFVAAYITIPIFFAFYTGHKIYARTPFYIPIPDVDAISGKREMDELEASDVPPVPKNQLQKFWYWLA